MDMPQPSKFRTAFQFHGEKLALGVALLLLGGSLSLSAFHSNAEEIQKAQNQLQAIRSHMTEEHKDKHPGAFSPMGNDWGKPTAIVSPHDRQATYPGTVEVTLTAPPPPFKGGEKRSIKTVRAASSREGVSVAWTLTSINKSEVSEIHIDHFVIQRRRGKTPYEEVARLASAERSWVDRALEDHVKYKYQVIAKYEDRKDASEGFSNTASVKPAYRLEVEIVATQPLPPLATLLVHQYDRANTSWTKTRVPGLKAGQAIGKTKWTVTSIRLEKFSDWIVEVESPSGKTERLKMKKK